MAQIDKPALRQALEETPNGALSPKVPALSGREYAPTPRVLAGGRLGRLNMEQIYARIGEFDPERITMHQRQLMRRDPMLKMGLHFCKVSLVNAPFHFDCSDPRIAAFADRAYRAIHVAFCM